ncbi:MAG: LytTR family transcriptional regulator [Bacteroidales bacterium]|nr:LytTR family transcriptional regulator [Bacteroidales bacterium]
MLIWEKNIPAYLTSKTNIVRFVLFTAVFALIFINIYAPFGVETWYDVTEVQLFLYSSLLILLGMLVIVASRFLMLLFSKRKPIRYSDYAAWIFAEIVSMALVYALIQLFFLNGNKDFFSSFKKSVQITALVILLPYAILWLYLSLQEKSRQLEKLSSEPRTEPTPFGMIPFQDEKKVLRFSVKSEDLLYLESADNYIYIHYLDHDKVSRYMVRNSLKNLEPQMSNMGLMRCHRSFMVNFEKVKLIKKEADGLKLELDIPAKLSLPVSKTYIEQIIMKFSDNQNY